MTNRDLVWVAAAVLVLGFVLGGVFLLLRHPSVPPAGATTDAAALTEPTPLPPLEPEPEPDEPAAVDAQAPPPLAPSPLASASTSASPRGRDAGAPRPDAPLARDAAPVVRAQNLLIHPVGHDKLCIDYSSHKDTLHLFGCHGKPNQRWTAAEDVGGAIHLMSAQGGCVVASGVTRGGEPAMTLGDCGATALHFRHFEEHRLQETQTGKCVAARRIEKGMKLSLEPCDASNPGQSWVLQ